MSSAAVIQAPAAPPDAEPGQRDVVELVDGWLAQHGPWIPEHVVDFALDVRALAAQRSRTRPPQREPD